ncbi:MAG: CpsB/CapC family capsule biosynthesis tyrosine phosphatase [Planctomycetota bacterium]
MIDIHAHVLPALDDGPATYAEALQMCRRAEAETVTAIVATPHMCDDLFDVLSADALQATEILQRLCRADGLSLAILPGADVRLHPELPEKIEARQALTLGDAGRYVLLELPEQIAPMQTIAFLERLVATGPTPVISHPERNLSFLNRPDMLRDFVEAGCLVQATAASFLGRFGRAAKTLAWRYLASGLIHVVASDAHSMDCGRFVLRACAAKIARRFGENVSRELFVAGPGRIVSGEEPATCPAASRVRGIAAGRSCPP